MRTVIDLNFDNEKDNLQLLLRLEVMFALLRLKVLFSVSVSMLEIYNEQVSALPVII